MYPGTLDSIVDLFEHLPDEEKRSLLISYADSAGKYGPEEGATYDLEDIRKDEECTDTVGIFLTVDEDEGDASEFKVSLGGEVQTLTRAMTSILCRSLAGATPQEILDCPADFVPKIIGAELVRQRSQTVYYVLSRMKGAAKVYLARKRAGETA
ncbi:SufE family protein [Verrucomicrobiales bacterium]|nr:SufE family protein [Verrucomicrobiales bacterium]